MSVIAALLPMMGVMACVDAADDEGALDVSFGVKGKHKHDDDEVDATMAVLFLGDGGIVIGSPVVMDEGGGGNLRCEEGEYVLVVYSCLSCLSRSNDIDPSPVSSPPLSANDEELGFG